MFAKMEQRKPDLVLEFDAPISMPPGPNTAQGGPSQNPVNLSAYLPLLEAVRNGDLHVVETFLNDHPEAVKAKITSNGETTLQIAALFEHSHIVRKLVQLMSYDDLLLTNNYGDTALAIAVLNSTEKGINAVKFIVEQNMKLVAIPLGHSSNWIPITLALNYGNIAMARYLYSITPLEALLPENGKHGAVFLNQCIICKMFDIAQDLVERCQTLLTTSYSGERFWWALVAVGSTFQSEIQRPFWKRWLHNCLLHQLVRSTLNFLGIKKINEAGLALEQYLKLLHAACDVLSTLNAEELSKIKIYDALGIAARRGNPEFIMKAVTMNITLLWTVDKEGGQLFHMAIRNRQAKVFSLIHGLVLKRVVNFTDNGCNTLLHMAGELAPSTQLNHISGALLQMQRELQWFKEVESIMPSMKKGHLNHDGLTAKELFTLRHKDLVKEGEIWTKGTANSCSVVAALVVTITFAAAFTVPGGNDQTTGYPIFLHEKLFMLFIISDAVSLFSSSTSLLMFLGLLTSRYAEDDFLVSLPKRLIVGLSTMFISIATMMIAFCAALFIMLQNQYSWIVIPVTVLASVPITLYIWLQLPLLVEIFMSTYGPGIFDRNVKPWP